ncbi:MAG: DNA polymerase III subunit alpha, partial [Mogibacterium sp.]|nr:DNA polymerase III subunit alpha [Mogibacterium sp.]
KSGRNFTVEDGKVRFGLLSVKNVGTGIIDAIIEAREMNGEPEDIFEFINGINPKELNRKAIESLIRAGALDDLNKNRAAMLAVCDEAVANAQKIARTVGVNQISLFQMDDIDDVLDGVNATPELPKIANFSDNILLAEEKEMLGVYLTGHPLDEYADLIKDRISARTSELLPDDEMELEGEEEKFIVSNSKFKDGDVVIMAGMLSDVRTMITKNNQAMARLQLEDYDGLITAIAFPKTYEKFKHNIRNDAIVAVKARLSMKEEQAPELLLESVVEIERISELSASRSRNNSWQKPAAPSQAGRSAAPAAPKASAEDYVKLRVSAEVEAAHGDSKGALYHITDILSLYPGTRPVAVYLPNGKMLSAGDGYRVDFCDELRDRLVRMLGETNVKG